MADEEIARRLAGVAEEYLVVLEPCVRCGQPDIMGDDRVCEACETQVH